MPYVYIPLPEGHEKAPGYCRSYMTTGLDIDGVCKRNGWEPKLPDGVAVYDEDGGELQPAPTKQPQLKEAK